VHISQRGARSYAVLYVFCVLTKVTHDKNFALELGCITSKHWGEADVNTQDKVACYSLSTVSILSPQSA
jgi:hypothetical protein